MLAEELRVACLFFMKWRSLRPAAHLSLHFFISSQSSSIKKFRQSHSAGQRKQVFFSPRPHSAIFSIALLFFVSFILHSTHKIAFIPKNCSIHYELFPFGLFLCVGFSLAEPLAVPPPITAAGSESSKANQTLPIPPIKSKVSFELMWNGKEAGSPINANCFISFTNCLLIDSTNAANAFNSSFISSFHPFWRMEWKEMKRIDWRAALHPPFKFNWFIWFRQFPSSINKSYWPWM